MVDCEESYHNRRDWQRMPIPSPRVGFRFSRGTSVQLGTQALPPAPLPTRALTHTESRARSFLSRLWHLAPITGLFEHGRVNGKTLVFLMVGGGIALVLFFQLVNQLSK